MRASFTVAQTDMANQIVSVHGNCKVVIATEGHIEDIYPFMRREDQLEVACMGYKPKEALEVALKTDAVTLTAVDKDDVPFAMFGSGQIEGMAYIWLLGTDGLLDNSYDFIKASRHYTQLFAQTYDCVFNYVHKENKSALKWLKFCGAKFVNTTEFMGEPFYEFVITVDQSPVKKPLTVNVDDFNNKVVSFENELKTLENAIVDPDEIEKINPLEHSFAEGMYVRKLVMPANQILVGKIHKQDHPYFIMSGDVSILTEDGVVRVDKPHYGMTKAGTKRVIYTHSETTWITVQHTYETDLKKIEEDVIAKGFNDPALTVDELNLLTKGTN